MNYKTQFEKRIVECDNVLNLIRTKRFRNIAEIERFIANERKDLVFILRKLS